MGMSEYQHGSMDTSEHQRNFAGFVRFSAWVCVVSVMVLVFLAVFNS